MLVSPVLLSVVLAVSPPVPESLEWAGRFANGLTGDARDREMAQEAVVLDIAMKGLLDEAMRRADGVEGWRRGVAYAEIAKMLAKKGRVDEAKVLIAKALEVAKGTSEGWQGPRVEAHAAQAQTLVGGMEATRSTTERLEQDDTLQYGGLTAVLRATSYAAKGEFAPAMAALEAAGKDTAIEIAWPMTQAYLDLARRPEWTAAQRLQVLEAAQAAASGIQERISKLDALEAIADACRQADLGVKAREVLDVFHADVAVLTDATVLKAPYLASEARLRARLGEREKARAILEEALRIGSQAYPIDRPAVLANVAAGWHVAGDATRAAEVLDSALGFAEGLVNARPRALAFVEIARVLARYDVPMGDPVRVRFQRALAGLKAPW
jgi:tetratricopeptide (TPR) repeat protein